MPNIPTQHILDRDLSVANVRDVCEVGGPALRAVVDEGIRVFERCNRSATGHEENLGLLFSLYQMLEFLDAVEITLANASTVGAVVLLRSALEAFWALEWIALDIPKHGAACAVVLIHMQIATWERAEEDHLSRQRFLEILGKDPVAQRIAPPVESVAAERIAGLRSVLDRPHLRDAETEYKRQKKKREFYSFWNGPQNVEQLAMKLNDHASYEILYRNWSQTSHAQDALRRISSADGMAAVRVFRAGEDIATIYQFAIVFGVKGMRAVLNHYRPDELDHSFKTWYAKAVAPSLRQLEAARGSESDPH